MAAQCRLSFASRFVYPIALLNGIGPPSEDRVQRVNLARVSNNDKSIFSKSRSGPYHTAHGSCHTSHFSSCMVPLACPWRRVSSLSLPPMLLSITFLHRLVSPLKSSFLPSHSQVARAAPTIVVPRKCFLILHHLPMCYMCHDSQTAYRGTKLHVVDDRCGSGCQEEATKL